jgi:putative ATPase
VGKTLYRRWQKAEDAIYAQANHPRLAALPDDLQALLVAAGATPSLDLQTHTHERLITPTLLQRWFSPGSTTAPSYRDGLAPHLKDAEIETIQQHLKNQFLHKTVPWRTVTAIVEV